MSNPIVLIHGAWHGAWAFDRVIDQLRDQGLQAYAPDLPLLGVPGDIEVARACIADHPQAVVLGHSYGGIIITHAVSGLDVSHLVYLAATVPEQDENIAAATAEYPPERLLNAMQLLDDGRVQLDPQQAITAFYDDCEPAAAEAAVARLRPHSYNDLPTLSSAPPWRDIESTYVICENDKALDPRLQRLQAQRVTNQLSWPCAHSPFLAAPERVVELLTRLAA